MGFGNSKSIAQIVLMVGLLLFVPSLWAGFLLDDFYYLGSIEGHFPEHNTNRGLFTFFINDEEATRDIASQGGYPWWIDERVRGEGCIGPPNSVYRSESPNAFAMKML